jgi:hypothetical protein
MRPNGLGLRLMSLQLQPGEALDGDRWPFDPFALPFTPFGDSGAGFAFGVGVVAEVRPVSLRVLIGLLLLDLARLNSALESVSSSSSSVIGICAAVAFFLADLVTGPK